MGDRALRAAGRLHAENEELRAEVDRLRARVAALEGEARDVRRKAIEECVDTIKRQRSDWHRNVLVISHNGTLATVRALAQRGDSGEVVNHRALLAKYLAHIRKQEGRNYLDAWIIDAELDYETDPPTVGRPAVFTDAELVVLRSIVEALPT